MTLFSALLVAAAPVVYSGEWRDPKRDRLIPIRVSYPTSGKRFKVIVFSHGLGGAETNMDPLVKVWVENGYAVFQPRHIDSQTNPQKLTLIERLSPKTLLSRLDDCKFIYAAIGTVEDYIPALKGTLDTEHIIQAGHSYGAMTTQALGGVKFSGRSFADPRPVAFCLISPQGSDRGLSKNSWSDFNRPMLAISGTDDYVPGINGDKDKFDVTARQNPFKFSPPGDKYLLWIQGATHNFGGITGTFNWPGAGKPNQNHVDWVAKTTLNFFNAYAKQDDKAKAWLRSGELTRSTSNQAELSSR